MQKDEQKVNNLDFSILFLLVSKVMVKEMSPIASRLLLFCLTIVDYGNYIPMGITQMADELLYSKRQCQRGMDELIYFKVIIKQQHPTDKRMVNYYTRQSNLMRVEDSTNHKSAIQFFNFLIIII